MKALWEASVNQSDSSLFNDGLSITRLRVYSVDDMLLTEWWKIGKDLVGSGRGLI
jgi:hypothetical protein